jgi:hypothetical protein
MNEVGKAVSAGNHRHLNWHYTVATLITTQ